jgi:hypothetical protein
MSKAEKNTARELLSKLDIGGFCLFAPCAIMFLMALEWGGTKYAWNSAKVIGLLCGSAGTFAIFVVWEFRQGDNAMIPYSMLRKKEVWSSCIVIFFFFGGLLTFTYYLPIYFQAVKGVAPSPSGVYILPGILSQMMMAVVSGVLGKSCVQTDDAVADFRLSWEVGILPSVDSIEWSNCRDCSRLNIYLHATHPNCHMGGLPVPSRHWSRLRYGYSAYLLCVKLQRF